MILKEYMQKTLISTPFNYKSDVHVTYADQAVMTSWNECMQHVSCRIVECVLGGSALEVPKIDFWARC